jgi:hypothetical protein
MVGKGMKNVKITGENGEGSSTIEMGKNIKLVAGDDEGVIYFGRDDSPEDKNINNKIAILITDLHIGGAERVVVNLANSFSNLGYEVEVVLLKAEGEFIDLLSSKVKLINLEVNKQRYALWKFIKYSK